MNGWKNITTRPRKLTARRRRELGFDDGYAGRPAASLEREYQTGYRLGFRHRHREGREVRRVSEHRFQILGGTTRANYGVTASLDDGRVLHESGLPTDALARIVAECDASGAKILCLSTPETIYRDLDGSRARGALRIRRSHFGESEVGRLELPEYRMLGRLGRTDLLA